MTPSPSDLIGVQSGRRCSHGLQRGAIEDDAGHQVGDSGIIVMGHRGFSFFSECPRRSHQGSRDGPRDRWDRLATSTSSRDANHRTLRAYPQSSNRV